jgi:dipeptidyl aminopeptidase/acylaminoacyl peptidase
MVRRAWLLALLLACSSHVSSPVSDPVPVPVPVPVPMPDQGTGSGSGTGTGTGTGVTGDAGYSGLGATSVPPDVVASFAAPALSPDVSRRIQSMLDVRGAGPGLFTRKGDRMLFTWRITGVAQVWRQDGPMKFPVQLTGGEDATTLVGLAPDDSFAVVSRDIGGSENPGLYLLDLAGGPLAKLQHEPDVQTFFGFVSDDSKSIFFRANDRAPDSYAIYRYDVATRAKEPVWTEPGLWGISDHAGDRLLLTKRLAADHFEVYTLDLATKTLTHVIGQGEVEDYAARFGATADTVLLRTNKTGDFHRLYAWKGGAVTPISPEQKHDVRAFDVDDARKRIYYEINDAGYIRTFVMDARTYKPITLPKLPAADNVTFGGASRDGRRFQVVIDGATRAPQTVAYDWSTKKLATWRVPSTPEIDVGAFAAASLESYPARDGTPIPMFVRRPAACAGAAKPCPVVVSFHGGPEGQSTAGFSTTAQLYVDAGFIYVQPNVRGSSGYGKTWLHVDDGPRRLDVISDIEDAATFIRREWAKGGVAPKVGVTGGSYGGYSTLMAMTYFAGAYDAGVSVVGMSNLTTFLANTAPYRRGLRASEYGDPDKDADALVKLSPLTYIDRLSAPLPVIQGLNDPRVPAGEAVQIYRAAEARGIERGLILFPDEGHGAIKRQNQVLTIGHTIAFFEKHLK